MNASNSQARSRCGISFTISEESLALYLKALGLSPTTQYSWTVSRGSSIW